MKKEFLEAGKIVNTHGVRGEVKIQPWADSAEFLRDFHTLYLDGAPVRVLRSRVHKNMLIAALEGVDTVDAAMVLKNKVLSIRRRTPACRRGISFSRISWGHWWWTKPARSWASWPTCWIPLGTRSTWSEGGGRSSSPPCRPSSSARTRRRGASPCASLRGCDGTVKVDIMTLFPDTVSAVLGESILGRAAKKGILDIRCVQIRDYNHQQTVPSG